MSIDVGPYKAKVYRAAMDTETENPWCASFPSWDPPFRCSADDGFHRTYLPTHESAMRFVGWSLLRDPVRLREWATYYGFGPVIDRLDALNDETPRPSREAGTGQEDGEAWE